ncbi:MAG: hypothetical protein AABY11_03165 [archaeon]
MESMLRVTAIVSVGLIILMGIFYGGWQLPTFSENTPPLTNEKNEVILQDACVVNEECAFVINAVSTWECISANCPPEESTEQPNANDPNYTWAPKFEAACVNAEARNYVNLEGEPLLVDARGGSCACVQRVCEITPTSLLETEQ